MLGVTHLWTYVLGTIAIVLLPGPNSMYVLSVASRWGIRAGYRGAAGVFLGDAILMALSASGLASLLRTYPALFVVVKYVGAGYLVVIGAGMLRGAWRRWRRPARAATPAASAVPTTSATPAASPAPEPASRPFRRALTISLLNPKAILFFVSFFVQFVDPTYPHPVVPFLVLGVIAEVASALYLTTLILAGTFLAAQLHRRRRLAAGMNTGVGALFVGFGAKLATASLN